jgi:hypothetical protein
LTDDHIDANIPIWQMLVFEVNPPLRHKKPEQPIFSREVTESLLPLLVIALYRYAPVAQSG